MRVLADAGQIRDAIANEPRVHLLIIHAPGDSLIGGDADACRRVVRKLGSVPVYETSGLAVHCPEMGQFANEWRALHRRPVSIPRDIRIYSNAICGSYVPDDDSVAAMLTAQACATIDFPATIVRAWEDGVRVFVEHGPRALCTGWISRTLGDRPHLAVSLDKCEQSSLKQAAETVSRLAAAGVEIDAAAFFEGVDRAETNWKRPKSQRSIEVPAHPSAVGLPPQVMAPAPPLPPIIAPYESPPVHGNGNGNGNGTIAALIGAMGAAHRAAVGAQVEALRQTAESRLAIFRSLAKAAPVPARSPQFSRGQLEIHASGFISSIFGPLFRRQDGFRRQVRMPEPPLLFPDRVTGIAGEPGSMKTGSVWTETDVRRDSWFLHENHVAPGILIEAGQADLLLISWLGVDFLNRDERVYRMLSCELTFSGALPRAGDTLAYDIHIDQHATLGDVRLFFFHFDCRVNGEVCLSMRNGQAGFFSDRELADPAGVIWDPASEKPLGEAEIFDTPARPQSSFTREQVSAFAEGRAFDCFGAGYELAATHTATPRIPCGQLQLIQEISELDPRGGPWKRGYMRVVNRIAPTDWFFEGHFKNDPCMPGTLMAEAGMQAMAFYMAALGFTLRRDGWRFEPIPNEMYHLRCRGQVVPTCRELTYEIFVHQVIAGPEPMIFADVLGTVDGVTKAVHGRRLGLRLVPDWPLEKLPNALEIDAPVGRGGAVVNGFEFGRASMLACAIGRPSDAFGEMYRRLDGPMRTVRLPGPPYLFMSRVARVDGAPESMKAGVECEAECDVDAHEWFFDDSGARLMPFCVLMETALQPCGWLASFAGCVSTRSEELYFRNLDGTATVYESIPPDAGVLTTRTRLTNLSRSGGIMLVAFDVETRIGERAVFTMKTGFGFFPKSALESQPGLQTTAAEKQSLAEPSNFCVDLSRSPARIASGKLLMLDRITGYWPAAGASGLGRLRAEKDVDPREWFFKAHFFQDPVMPGSLGIESMVQLLRFFMIEAGLEEGLDTPYFEPLAHGREITWKYRGQVTPTAKRIVVEMEINEIIRGRSDVTAVAEASLWVDGTKIYQAKGIAARLVPAPAFGIDPEHGVFASTFENGSTHLRFEDIRHADCLPGTAGDPFLTATEDVEELVMRLSIKEHVARCSGTHPSHVTLAQDLKSATSDVEPFRRWQVHSETDACGVTVSGEEAFLDFDAARSFWKKDPESSAPPAIERLLASLIRRFVRRIRLEDPAAVCALRGRPVLFLANHQTLLESALFSVLAPAVTGSPIIALAKIEQRMSVLVQTMLRIFSAFPELPGEPILYFDQRDPASLLSVTQRLQTAFSSQGRSALIHVEGTRNLTCRRTVRAISAALLDMAVAADVPILPVRFTGGLPVEPASHKLDLPVDFGKQDYWIGRPIFPEQIRGLSLVERKSLVLGAINSLGVPNDVEIPHPADAAFAAAIERRTKAAGIGVVEATVLECAGMAMWARIEELLVSW
jgi:3-hydroxymyristoyl/3-hydroxydecanoyl-(acyl carrier protein) dehydratase/1-acyl-sn-glycerol-3-phosphate acyltransferase